MKPVFNGKTYGKFGFTIGDGDGVCYSFYEVELYLKLLRWKSNNYKSRKKIKDYLVFRDGLQCKYCTCRLTYKEATVDHFVPPKMWQSWLLSEYDHITNLVLSCRKCNLIKGSKSPVGFIRYLEATTIGGKLRIVLCRYTTRIKLIVKETRTLSGNHKGHYKYMKQHGITHIHSGAENSDEIIV